MRVFLAALSIIILAAGARADPSHLLGIWDIEVVDGTANGDGGFIRIEDGGDHLTAELHYRDADADVNALERCVVREMGGIVSVTCTVLSPISPDYYPDDFNLRFVTPNRMEGRLHSATSGTAIFTRREVPMS